MHASESIAIKVEHLSKQYLIGQDQGDGETFREALTRAFTAPFRRLTGGSVATSEIEKFWALKDVSFEVPRGEVVGIVGRNGAGKSTLLKILSRITEPTQGRIEIRGRVASLLEVGTGFHGELTGRENIYLNGAILGMTRAEINRKFDDIVDFAQIKKFIDTPVKHYSSGMYVRLAFAVAAHLDQDILFVDEVLAVGDVEFQRRCLNKMKDISSAGRTVLFVSHNTTALRNLCSCALLLEDGVLTRSGPIGDVLSVYLGSRSGSTSVDIRDSRARVSRSETPAAIARVFVVPVGGTLGEPILGTSPFSIGVEVEVQHAGQFEIFLHCFTDQQQIVFSTGSFFEERLNGLRLETGTHLFECAVPGHLLTDGTYVLDVILLKNRQVITTEADVLSFQVVDDFPGIDGWHYRPAGVIRPKATWRLRQPPRGMTLPS
jgi:lipopolysaccharide transport system ATP-binding protein